MLLQLQVQLSGLRQGGGSWVYSSETPFQPVWGSGKEKALEGHGQGRWPIGFLCMLQYAPGDMRLSQAGCARCWEDMWSGLQEAWPRFPQQEPRQGLYAVMGWDSAPYFRAPLVLPTACSPACNQGLAQCSCVCVNHSL